MKNDIDPEVIYQEKEKKKKKMAANQQVWVAPNDGWVVPRENTVPKPMEWVGRDYDSHPGQDDMKHECTIQFDGGFDRPRRAIVGSCLHFSHTKILGCSFCGLGVLYDEMNFIEDNPICGHCHSLIVFIETILEEENPTQPFVVQLNRHHLPPEAQGDLIMALEDKFDVHAEFRPTLYTGSKTSLVFRRTTVLTKKYTLQISPLGNFVCPSRT